MTRWRGAVAGFRFASIVLGGFVVLAALKFGRRDLPDQTLVQALTVITSRSLAYAGALLPAVLLLVGAWNTAPVARGRRLAWLLSAVILAAAIAGSSPVPARLLGFGLRESEFTQLWLFIVQLGIVLEFRHRVETASVRTFEAERESMRANEQLTHARLHALRAQVAPHFLFNTLATVRQLARADRRAAAAMLTDLHRYFSAALTRVTSVQWPLEDEARLVDAFLRVHRVRMGTRLDYSVAVHADAARAQVPVMMLLTLVENAIKHGLNPLPEGGTIAVRARREGHAVHIEVEDTGRGFSASAGHGIGLANLRSQLSLLHGTDASLALAQVQPKGFRAVVTIPTGSRL